MSNEFRIPPVTDEKIQQVLNLVRPVVKKGNELWYIQIPDPRNVAFPWDPKLTKRAGELQPVTIIRTLHTWGHYALFKPSLAEVVAQLPEDLTDLVAFLVEGPNDADDLNKEKDALDAGFHVAQTTLFKEKQLRFSGLFGG